MGCSRAIKRTAFAALGKPTAISLALILGFVAFESTLHSVHHLSNPEEAAQCQVLAVSEHLSGVGVETPGVCSQLPAAEAPAPARAVRGLATVFRPDTGRAPPPVLG